MTSSLLGQSPVDMTRSAKLDTKKPGVSLAFLRYESVFSKRLGKKLKLAWIGLINNMRFTIRACGHDSSISVVDRPGLFFRFEKVVNFDDAKSRDNSEVPIGMVRYHGCDIIAVKKGAKYAFPIVVDDIMMGGQVVVDFYYPWEDVYNSYTGGEPTHSAVLRVDELP